MPYIPDLIPKENRVLPDYFNVHNPKGKSGKERSEPLAIIAAIVFFAAALFFYHYLFMALFLAISGFICTGPGKRSVEKAGDFKLTPKIRMLFCGMLLVLCIPLWPYYLQVDADAEQARQETQRKAQQFTADSLKQENNRRDSLARYLAATKQQPTKPLIDKIKYGEKFAATDDERRQLKDVLQRVNLQYIADLIRQKQFDNAQPVLDEALKDDPGNPNLLYNRALCYLSHKNFVLAVNDLDSAMNRGYKAADGLYNKINPLRKRIVGYETLCSDGSSSSATGRGACSWHGGVAQWNHPIYETYRKYGNRQDNL